MKKQLLLLLMLCATLANAQQTITVSPFQLENATGTSFPNGSNQSGDIVDIQPINEEGVGNKGYVTFDLSSLPNGAEVVSANFQYTVAPPSGGSISIAFTNATGRLTQINKNSTISTISNADIAEGVAIGELVYDGNYGPKAITINAEGINRINNASGTFICLGMNAATSGGGYERVTGYESTNPALAPPTLSLSFTVAEPKKPSVEFSVDKTNPFIFDEIQFTDNSGNGPITAWAWEFGDENTSTIQNPTHTYADTGKYTVKLTVTNEQGDTTLTKNNFITVSGLPAANFEATPIQIAANDTVFFTNTSLNAVSYAWDFDTANLGTLVSPEMEPFVVYTENGVYSVQLIVTNKTKKDTLTLTDYITVGTALPKPVADFSSSVNFLEVSFTDNTTEGPTSWLWDFISEGVPGDFTSTEQNPVFTYQEEGTYKACLTATAPGGKNTICQDITVNTPPAPIADFTFKNVQSFGVSFTDASKNVPNVWAWNFGDSNNGTSEEKNPTYTFPAAGTYNVSLISGNASGNDFISKTVIVNELGVGINNQSVTVIDIYPNPASSNLTIKTSNPLEDVTIEVYNILGTQLFSTQLKSLNTYTIPTSDLNNGMYFVKISLKGSSSTKKFSVKH
ncbi:MAG: PKD repeat protein [Sphingobacteriales bacterium]|jgi:PKD repeat protein